MSGDLPDLSLVAQFASGNQEIGDVVRQGFSLERGSAEPSLTGLVADAGSLRTTLENFDRALDPSNTASPYYPDVVPGVVVSLVATWDSTVYPLFLGRCEGWGQDYGAMGLDQIIPFTVKDAVAELARAQVVGRLHRRPTGTRINDVLNAVDWPGSSSVDPGTAMVPSVGTRGEKGGYAWSLIGDAVAAEWGYGFANGAGDLIFLDRNGIAAVSEYSTPIAIFGDQAGELPYDDIEIPFDTSRIVNDADDSYNDRGSTAHAQDLASQAEPWGVRSWSQSIPFESGALARSYVKHLVRQYATPTVRISMLRITPQDQPDDLWPIVLALEPGQMFTVKKTPIGGGARIERDVFVRGVAHSLDNGEWSTLVSYDDANLVTVHGHVGDGTLCGDPGTYDF